jgi:hypothetical protein
VVRLVPFMVVALALMTSFGAAEGTDQAKQAWEEVRSFAHAACPAQYAELDDFYASVAAGPTVYRSGLWIDWEELGDKRMYFKGQNETSEKIVQSPDMVYAVSAFAVTWHDYFVSSLLVGNGVRSIGRAPAGKNTDLQADELHVLIQKLRLLHSFVECLRPTEGVLSQLPPESRDAIEKSLAYADCTMEFEINRRMFVAYNARTDARQFAAAYFDISEIRPGVGECKVDE